MQTDLALSNQARTAFRIELNNHLEALASCSAGDAAPSTTFPHQFWADTANGVLWIRNEANSDWLLVASLNGARVQSKSSGFTVGVEDFDSVFLCSGAITVAFDAAATLSNGFRCKIVNVGTTNVTLDPDGSETIDGATTLLCGRGEGYDVECNGSALYCPGRIRVNDLTEDMAPDTAADFVLGWDTSDGRIKKYLLQNIAPATLVIGTPVTGGTIGTAITGISADAWQIEIVLAALSTTGAGFSEIRLGDSGGIESGTAVQIAEHDSGGQIKDARIVVTKVSGTTWIVDVKGVAESVTLSGTLDRFQVRADGTSIDAGTLQYYVHLTP
ncbi:MAG TPA: hypothetical protein VJU83_09770 [Burkholderiales bacterium]|nr:hypothetical protein [Burkholderiales bacterium]